MPALSKNKYGKLFLIICAILAFTACSSSKHVRDLKEYIDNLRKASAAEVPLTAPVFEMPKPVVFETNSERSPFEAAAESTISGNKNSAEVAMHPLEGFPISELKFKGIVAQGSNQGSTESYETLAFILAPDNKLYQVKIGDIIGDHYGKIEHIYADRIEITEPVKGTKNQTSEKTVTLQRKD